MTKMLEPSWRRAFRRRVAQMPGIRLATDGVRFRDASAIADGMSIARVQVCRVLKMTASVRAFQRCVARARMLVALCSYGPRSYGLSDGASHRCLDEYPVRNVRAHVYTCHHGAPMFWEQRCGPSRSEAPSEVQRHARRSRARRRRCAWGDDRPKCFFKKKEACLGRRRRRMPRGPRRPGRRPRTRVSRETPPFDLDLAPRRCPSARAGKVAKK